MNDATPFSDPLKNVVLPVPVVEPDEDPVVVV